MTKLNEFTLCQARRNALFGAMSAGLVYGFIGLATGTAARFNLWDKVAQLRLEFPPYMVSYTALCSENEKHPSKILQIVCDKKNYSATIAQEN